MGSTSSSIRKPRVLERRRSARGCPNVATWAPFPRFPRSSRGSPRGGPCRTRSGWSSAICASICLITFVFGVGAHDMAARALDQLRHRPLLSSRFLRVRDTGWGIVAHVPWPQGQKPGSSCAGALPPRSTVAGSRTTCRVTRAVFLFVYLVANRDRHISRDEVVEALWPDGPPPAVLSNLRALVSKVRRAVWQRGARPRWSLPPGLRADAWIDLEAAGEAIARAEAAAAREEWGACVRRLAGRTVHGRARLLGEKRAIDGCVAELPGPSSRVERWSVTRRRRSGSAARSCRSRSGAPAL